MTYSFLWLGLTEVPNKINIFWCVCLYSSYWHATTPIHKLRTKTLHASLVVNSFAPGRCEWNFRNAIIKLMLETGGWSIPSEMSLGLTDDKSTLIQVMAWCCQATNHYLSQCWPKSMSPYSVTRPQWVDDDTKKFCFCYKCYWLPINFNCDMWLLEKESVKITSIQKGSTRVFCKKKNKQLFETWQ